MDQAFWARIPALILLCMTQFMIPFDYLSITLSLLAISQDFDMPSTMLPWIMSSYLLTFGGFLLLGGKLADMYGRRRLLIIGLCVFSFFSVVTALTTNMYLFLAARACKGIGSALICPAMLSILNSLFSDARSRHRALAVYWFCSVLGGAAGTGIGGYLTTHSWRLTLFVNVPIALILALLAPRILPMLPSSLSSRKLDYGGAICSTLGIGTLIFSITNGMWFGLTPATVAALLISPASFALLYKIERTHPSPIMPPRLLSIRNVIGANIFCFFWAAANSKYLVARFLQEVQHYDSGEAGIALLPHSAVSLLAAGIAVRLLDRYGALKAMLLGAMVEGAGILALCTVQPQSHYAVIGMGIVLVALGVSVAGISAKLPACWDAQAEDQGVASGMIFATQQLANAFAIPIYSAVMERTADPNAASVELGLSQGYRFAFATALLFIIIAAVAAGKIIRERTTSEAVVEPDAPGAMALAGRHKD